MKLRPLERFVPQHTKFSDETLMLTCRSILSAPSSEIAEVIKALQSVPEENFGSHACIPGMLSRLSKQYTECDNGNLVAAILMNYLTLGPGDSVFIPEDGIHAYLEGDIVECMARSDNVLNTGFCPRADRDSYAVFTQALTFQSHSADDVLLPRKKSEKGLHGNTDEYAPPLEEFNVLSTCLSGGETETHKAILGPSLMIVSKGHGKMNIPGGVTIELYEGHVYFIGQGVALDFSTEKGMQVFRPYVE